MRTARALTVPPSILCAEGVSAPGGGVSATRRGVCSQGGWVSAPAGVCSQGVSAPGGWGVCSGGMYAPRGCLLPRGGGCDIPACTEAEPPVLTESQTPVKIIPCPNFVAGGYYEERLKIQLINDALNCKYTLQQHKRRGGCCEDVSDKKTSC